MLNNPLADKVFSVSELDRIISSTVDELFYGLSVEGEVTNYKINSSKHWYFYLKDKDGSVISCTFFRSDNWRTEPLENGEFVRVKGNLSFWAKGGSLSFNVKTLERKGEGDLRQEIEKRKEYYQSLGYFNPDVKKPIPKEINTIGVVTSDTGAVIHDILQITKRRAPGVNIILFPSMVQGEGADESIANRIRNANMFSSLIDVLIVARGGGSEEDLLPYSSRLVIEAIHESRIPVISAIGHEQDNPLSDLVADLRASTPSAAAEIVTEENMRRRERLLGIKREILTAIREKLYKKERKLKGITLTSYLIARRLSDASMRLEKFNSAKSKISNRLSSLTMEVDRYREDIYQYITLFPQRANTFLLMHKSDKSSIIAKLKGYREKLCYNGKSNRKEMENRLGEARLKAKYLEREVESLSPLRILSRGYAIAEDEKGNVIRDASLLEKGDEVRLRVMRGSMKLEVKEIEDVI